MNRVKPGHVLRVAPLVVAFFAGISLTHAMGASSSQSEGDRKLIGTWRATDSKSGLSTTLRIWADGTYSQVLDSKAPRWSTKGNLITFAREPHKEHSVQYTLSSNGNQLSIAGSKGQIVFRRIDPLH